MDWKPTQFMHPDDVGNDAVHLPVVIDEMRSPFYFGVRWAVRRGRNVLRKSGTWEYEPLQSSRTDAFYERCRFKVYEDAVAAANAARMKVIRDGKYRLRLLDSPVSSDSTNID